MEKLTKTFGIIAKVSMVLSGLFLGISAMSFFFTTFYPPFYFFLLALLICMASYFYEKKIFSKSNAFKKTYYMAFIVINVLPILLALFMIILMVLPI